ncbi:aspartyl-phosphate phosphatase Spo0E family protein [Bacillus thermotolerans]|uniref:Aspartyl-phosphate phosphatase Spo0E family protein n=1 Tax=Bacillus thermotolerans TaxID=1221996 RepID=A0A0F5HQE9_BACTR|nr:aspartyl-phosphate phosphatase Spo0E family protein [Bacillus thermotolerans]KKB33045.1 hypothetical protein QY96_00846 [Bacillus thermotolerans]KKB35579.1 hypothetical protein QY95_03432 [Bacillus thermotolerans]KKB36104.1 hypothetical protein QY97_01372 [Bacillus thermotolerans]
MEMQESCYELLNQINNLRKKMIVAGLSKGLGHADTLKYSQELDKLIFRHQTGC